MQSVQTVGRSGRPRARAPGRDPGCSWLGAIVAVAVCVAAWPALAGDGGGRADAVRAAPKVLIGVENDWPPFAWAPKSGAPIRGFAVELVRESFARAGVPIQLRPMPFARCMHEARNGQVMACFNALKLPDNEADYLWPAQPLFHEPLGIFARVAPGAAPGKPVTIDDLGGKRVGYHQGYHYAEWFSQHASIVRVPASNDVALLRMLNAGRTDYALFGASAGAWRLHSEPSLKGLPVQKVGVDRSNAAFWIAFSKQHPAAPDTLQRFEQGLREVKASPTWAQLHRQHLPGTEP